MRGSCPPVLEQLIRRRLLQAGLVDFRGFVVGGFGGGAFGFADLVFLGVPADFDGLFAPVDALLAGSDRLAADFDPDRVRVDARQANHFDSFARTTCLTTAPFGTKYRADSFSAVTISSLQEGRLRCSMFALHCFRSFSKKIQQRSIPTTSCRITCSTSILRQVSQYATSAITQSCPARSASTKAT